MKKEWKRFTALALGALIVFQTTGCSSQKTADTASESSQKEAQTSGEVSKESSMGEEEKTATLRMLNWGNTEEEAIANDAIGRFKEKHPGVEVEQTCVPVDSWSDFIQKWITMSTSGEAPDVINLGLEGAKMAVANDLLLPLDEIVAGDAELQSKKEQYAESLLEGFSEGGILYGLPSGTQTMVMYYNKDIFDEKGVEYPKEGWTWDEFMETAEKLTYEENGKTIYGYGLSSSYFQLTPWWATNSAYPVSEDYEKPALNSPAMLESITFLKSMVDKKVTPDPISSDVYTMFSSGQLAMVGAGRCVLNTWQDAGMKNFDCVQWPKKTEEGSVYGGSAWCIGSVTKEKELAVELLKEMVADETLTAVAAGGQQIPPTEKLACDTEIMGTVPDNILGLWKAVTIASPVAAPVFFGDIEQATLRGLENVFSGSMSVEDAMNQAQSEVETTIANK